MHSPPLEYMEMGYSINEDNVWGTVWRKIVLLPNWELCTNSQQSTHYLLKFTIVMANIFHFKSFQKYERSRCTWCGINTFSSLKITTERVVLSAASHTVSYSIFLLSCVLCYFSHLFSSLWIIAATLCCTQFYTSRLSDFLMLSLFFSTAISSIL